MKYFLFLILIFSLFFTTSCEKNSESSMVQSETLLELKASDCPGCSSAPIGPSCCCTIEIVTAFSSSAAINLCGTSDGPGTCTGTTPPSSCSTLSAGPNSHNVPLSLTNPGYAFCALQNSYFRIRNLGGAATLKLSCSNGFSVSTITFSIVPSGVEYITMDDSCVPVICM